MLKRRTDPKTATQASLRNRNALGRFTRALLNKKNTGKMLRTSCGPRPRHTTHVVRACAVEIHLEILQEPLDTEIYRQNAADQSRDKHAQSKCIWIFYKSHFIRKMTGKMPRTS